MARKRFCERQMARASVQSRKADQTALETYENSRSGDSELADLSEAREEGVSCDFGLGEKATRRLTWFKAPWKSHIAE